MSAQELKKIIAQMEPGAAASAMALLLKELFPLLDEGARVRLVADLIGGSEGEKVVSLVHL
jgi:hypothetical protein